MNFKITSPSEAIGLQSEKQDFGESSSDAAAEPSMWGECNIHVGLTSKTIAM